MSVVPTPLTMEFADENDGLTSQAYAFYETAKHCNARLITDNIRHFPKDGTAVLPREFLEE
ncbi:hypothetical protein AGMMS50293_11780 [Spirochaetia bacterium]|nr:hypothetical protein AGMMS50293_11780 [Spirochaetia bacterium]